MHWLLGAVGGLLGGVVGYFAVSWLAQNGFYAMVLPGALVGLGTGWLGRSHSLPRGIVAGVAAVISGTLIEWQVFYSANALSFFLQNINEIGAVSFAMIGLGGVLGFAFGKGNPQLVTIKPAGSE